MQHSVKGFYSATNTVAHCHCHVSITVQIILFHVQIRIGFVFWKLVGLLEKDKNVC